MIRNTGTLLDKLDADLALFRKAFNQRILYFRQLQEISDSVAEVTWDSTIAEAIQECKAEQTDLASKINTNRARQRYLDHIGKHRNDGTMDEDDETCILCRCDFKRGFITQWCGRLLVVHHR
jgi:E3 ubiquitin-protein ligase SHPRH